MGNNIPKLSIVVPIHNEMFYMHKGLESIKEQSFKDYELIVVCDACTDNSAAIARKYTPKVFEVNFARDGLARNVGLDHAQGEWLTFMDDDDWWLHEFVFQQIADNIGRCQEDIFNFDVIWKGRGYIRQTAEHCEPMTCGHVYRRAFIGDTRFSDATYSSDTGFWASLLKKEPMAVFFPMPLYYYNYMRKGSLSWKHAKGEV